MLSDGAKIALGNRHYNGWLDLIEAVEQAVLAKLREGGVELPVSQTPGRCNACRQTGALHCNDPMNCGGMPWHYTEAQLLDYGDRRAADVVPQWISMSERMPSTDSDVLGNTPMVLVHWKRDTRDLSLPVIDVSNTVYLSLNKDKATHWMPLPAAPKEQSNG